MVATRRRPPSVVGRNIRKFRLALDPPTSQRQLALRAGVSEPLVFLYETGQRKQPTAPILRKLASALGVTLADLYSMPKRSGRRAAESQSPDNQ